MDLKNWKTLAILVTVVVVGCVLAQVAINKVAPLKKLTA